MDGWLGLDDQLVAAGEGSDVLPGREGANLLLGGIGEGGLGPDPLALGIQEFDSEESGLEADGPGLSGGNPDFLGEWWLGEDNQAVDAGDDWLFSADQGAVEDLLGVGVLELGFPVGSGAAQGGDIQFKVTSAEVEDGKF